MIGPARSEKSAERWPTAIVIECCLGSRRIVNDEAGYRLPTVNVLALHSFPIERLLCTQVEVVQVKLPHRPGEIAPVATRLGEANININYVAWSSARIHRSFSLVSTKSPKRLHSWNKPPPLLSHRF